MRSPRFHCAVIASVLGIFACESTDRTDDDGSTDGADESCVGADCDRVLFRTKRGPKVELAVVILDQAEHEQNPIGVEVRLGGSVLLVSECNIGSGADASKADPVEMNCATDGPLGEDSREALFHTIRFDPDSGEYRLVVTYFGLDDATEDPQPELLEVASALLGEQLPPTGVLHKEKTRKLAVVSEPPAPDQHAFELIAFVRDGLADLIGCEKFHGEDGAIIPSDRFDHHLLVGNRIAVGQSATIDNGGFVGRGREVSYLADPDDAASGLADAAEILERVAEADVGCD